MDICEYSEQFAHIVIIRFRTYLLNLLRTSMPGPVSDGDNYNVLETVRHDCRVPQCILEIYLSRMLNADFKHWRHETQLTRDRRTQILEFYSSNIAVNGLCELKHKIDYAEWDLKTGNAN